MSYTTKYYTSAEFESHGNPPALDFLENFPTTINQLEAEILYWRNLQDFINFPSSFHDSAIGEIVNVLETISSLPPRPDQRKRFFTALAVFNQVQEDSDYGVEETSYPSSSRSSPPESHHYLVRKFEYGYSVEQMSYQTLSQPTPPVSPQTYSQFNEWDYDVDEMSDATLATSHISPPISPSRSQAGGDYHCPDCHQSFARTNALSRHISSIHQKPGVSCPFCPPQKQRKKTFNRSDNFQRHVSKAHEHVRDDDEAFVRCVHRLYQSNGARRMARRI